MNFETIILEVTRNVAVITLNRPDALNALTVQVASDFCEAITSARKSGARAIVLTGAGRAFCSGGDLREMQKIAATEGRIEAFFEEPLRLLHESILLIRQTPVPIIAAVNGVAAGAGCNLALACDIVIAAESAKFTEAFVKIGLTPDCGGTFMLPKLVGTKRAAELLMTGDAITAARAAEIGMINSVVPDSDLMPAAMQLAERLSTMPTAAIGRIKSLIDASANNGLKEQLALEHATQLESGKTSDFKEGVAAFIEKRSPKFVGG